VEEEERGEEEEEEDVAVVRSREAEVDAEEEAAFDKELAAMMSVRRSRSLPSLSLALSSHFEQLAPPVCDARPIARTRL
jgi:hypothetical protein